MLSGLYGMYGAAVGSTTVRLQAGFYVIGKLQAAVGDLYHIDADALGRTVENVFDSPRTGNRVYPYPHIGYPATVHGRRLTGRPPQGRSQYPGESLPFEYSNAGKALRFLIRRPR